MAVLAAGAALAAPAATAKDFDPGDVRVCNAKRCVAITDREVLPLFASFMYGPRQPRTTPAARLGAPYFELRFRNGYVTGIVGARALDRFLSYGVNLDQFARGKWYRLPAATARELRTLTRSLEPLRLTRAALAKSH